MQANILVDEKGHACLSDFGLSEIKAKTESIRMTESANQAPRHVGTLSWMAPEQFIDGPSKQTDIYSFGITMWEIYTMKVPYQHMLHPVEAFIHFVGNLGKRPEMPEHFRTSDADLWELMEEAWDQDPAVRPAAHELSSRIGRLSYITPPKDVSALAFPGSSNPAYQTHFPADSRTPSSPTPSRRVSTGDMQRQYRQKAPDGAAPPSVYKLLPEDRSQIHPHRSVTFPVPVVHGMPVKNIDGVYMATHARKTVHPNITAIHYPDCDSTDTLVPSSYQIHRKVSRQVSLSNIPPKRINITNHGSVNLKSEPGPVWQRIERYLHRLIRDWPIETLLQAKQTTEDLNAVNDVALSMWMLQMFKRYVKGREEEGKPNFTLVNCHMIFPIHVAMVNGAIQDGTREGAITALKEFWELIGQRRRPDVVLAMGRYWLDESRWVVHKCVAVL